jgi:2-polyprenyl-6-methoxyphenol hydroxylase-like FAD-dependent oxidoreductase
MSFKRVVVLGGGPVGLLCAIEARQNFVKDVVVVEKRSGYSRTNVPVLDQDLRNHMKQLGVHTQMGLGAKAMGATSFSRIESALLDRARAVGVEMLRPYVVAGVTGTELKKHGRYKSMLLTVREWDDKTRAPKVGGQTKHLKADLLVVASGGGAAADAIVTQTLKFDYEKLKAKNYGAYAIFEEKGMSPGLQVGTAKHKAAFSNAGELAGAKFHFQTADHNYLLTSLSGITRDDFKILQGSTGKLKTLLDSLNQVFSSNVVEQIKDVEKNVGIFKIAIQRARQFQSPQYPAVLVGDAAVTPHPEKGSGYTTGFRGYEELCRLFEALKKTDRSKDNSVAFQSFNDRYELHASRKAIEGTFTVLLNLQKTLSVSAAEMQRDLASARNPHVKTFIQEYLQTAALLCADMESQVSLAKFYFDYLKPDTGTVPTGFRWENTVGDLWGWIADTWADIKKLTQGIHLMDDRLDRVQGALRLP